MPDNMVREGSNPYPEYTIRDLYAFLSAHERILDPLGMRMSGTVVAGEVERWMTQGHERSGDVAPYRNWPNLPGMGALRSNAQDMLRFLAANIGEPTSRLERVMRSAHEVRAAVNENTDIGLNWQVRKFGDRRIIMHGGATAGYSTRIAFDPDLRVGYVLLTNTEEFGDDIGLDFLRRGLPLAIPEVSIPAEVLAPYVGAYAMEPGGTMVVRMEPEGWLTMQAPGNVRFRMHAESDSRFYVRRTPWRFTFTRDAAGQVVGVVADLEGTERRATRVSDEGPPPAVVAGNATLDVPIIVEQMAPYVGTYALESGDQTLDLRVFIENGRLMGQPAGQPPSRLEYQGNHEFRPTADIEIRLVFVLENGRAERVTLHDEGNVYPGRRKQ